MFTGIEPYLIKKFSVYFGWKVFLNTYQSVILDSFKMYLVVIRSANDSIDVFKADVCKLHCTFPKFIFIFFFTPHIQEKDESIKHRLLFFLLFKLL